MLNSLVLFTVSIVDQTTNLHFINRDVVPFSQFHQPPYASCLLFEVYEREDLPYLQIFYKNSTESNFPPLDIPNCDTECPLDDFYRLYAGMLPTVNVDDACKLRNDEPKLSYPDYYRSNQFTSSYLSKGPKL